MKMWLLGLLGVIGQFLRAIFERGIQDQLDQILPIALTAIMAVAQDPSIVTSSQRRERAFDRISDELAQRSIVAAASTINFAIELALQRGKADLGA